MNKASTETASTETKQLSLMDDDISQSDYERIRDGKTVEVEVEKSASVADEAADETTDDDSETSQTDGDEDDSDDESDTAKDNEGHKKPKRGFKKRIDKLNGKLTAAQQEMELLRRENEALKNPKPKESQEETLNSKAAASEPNPDDYETSTEFYRAHARWVATEEIKAAKEAEKIEAEKARLINDRTSRVDTHNKKVDEYRKDNPDFDKHIKDFFADQGTDFSISLALEETLTDSDLGPAILHELVKDPDEFERINSLGAMGVARAIGRLEEKLSATSANKKTEIKTKTTKAPPPAKPISASSANGKKSVYDDDLPQKEYERIRNEQEKRRASNF